MTRKDNNLEINEFARFLKVSYFVNIYWGNKTCQAISIFKVKTSQNRNVLNKAQGWT